MKKIFLFGIISILTFTSCAESKAVLDTGKEVRGDWTITDVTFDGINQSYVNAKVFDEADPKCYIGSHWHLIQNNNSGFYTLTGSANCPSGTTNLKWFITDEGGNKYFNFKKVYEGEKPKNVVSGYRMKIQSSSDSYMIMQQEIPFEGGKISINYTFTKN